MDEVLYRKVGRRYRPMVKVDVWDYRPPGAYLTIVRPGIRSIVSIVDIDAASVHAAIKIAADAMIDRMSKASDLQPAPQSTPITLEQRALLDQLAATGFNASVWNRTSFYDIIDAGMRELKAVMDSE